MSIRQQIKALKSLKKQSGVKLNKITEALNKGDLESAFNYLEQHRGLNTRFAYELNQLAKIVD
jgi:hypothetical protein|tara:strand:+ start:36 stop:224 length:189 start_codon:yes stop_codon:yes gene_type:complete